jgi:hypothetical protein
VSAPYVSWNACAHGLSADDVQLRRDERHGALYLELADNAAMNIRIQVRQRAHDDAERFAAELERNRDGLRRLAAVAEQAAQEIEQLQRDGAR